MPGVLAPVLNSEFENDNINENIVTGDDDDGNNDGNKNAIDLSGDSKDDNSEGEDSVSDNNNINPTTNPTDGDPPLILLLALTGDNDGKDDPGDYNEFCYDYDLNKKRCI